jgi:hypothetical protein
MMVVGFRGGGGEEKEKEKAFGIVHYSYDGSTSTHIYG